MFLFSAMRARPTALFSHAASKPHMDTLLMLSSSSSPSSPHSNPVVRFRILRALLFLIFTFTSFFLLHIILARSGLFPLPLPFSKFPQSSLLDSTSVLNTKTSIHAPSSLSFSQFSNGEQQQQQLNETRAVEISAHDRHMVYIPSADVLLVTMAKAGSSTLYHWLYRGLTGHSRWDASACGGSHIHNKSSPCWTIVAMPLYSFTPSEQATILFSTTSRTLRIAIQRNPFERLVSAYKSKFTCEDDAFRTDVHERQKMVRGLLRTSAHNKTCLTISEFAAALETYQEMNGQVLDELDDHIKPQEFYFESIQYHMVLDVNHLSDISSLRPLVERLPFKYLENVKNGLSKRHDSGDKPLFIPDNAAAKLYAFALESKPGRVKFMSKDEEMELNKKPRVDILKHLPLRLKLSELNQTSQPLIH